MTTATAINPYQRVVGGPDPWLRYDAKVVDVKYAERTIEVIVIPYEQEIKVAHPTKPNGGLVEEVISRGAFDGIERRANRIKANREHEKTLTFGKAASFRTGDKQGLRAEIRVARTLLGDETLNLCDEGCLEASAGFWPELDDRGRLAGMTWENPTRYRITKAFLDHISLVSEGAYGEKAGVLAVRAAAAAAAPAVPEPQHSMPVLDSYVNDELRKQEAAMDAKYIRG